MKNKETQLKQFNLAGGMSAGLQPHIADIDQINILFNKLAMRERILQAVVFLLGVLAGLLMR